MPLAQVAILLKIIFIGNPGRRLGTRTFLPFLTLVLSCKIPLFAGGPRSLHN
jgi:hypothetical protein